MQREEVSMAFVITLSNSSHRGPIVRKSAATRRDAFETATVLLDLDQAAASRAASPEMVAVLIIEEGDGVIEETIEEVVKDWRGAKRDGRHSD
jgi:hypothetical protein